MKLKAFSNPLLNLGSIDIELASRRQLSVLACAACGFTGEGMFYSSCNHVLCTDCTLVLEPANGGEEVVEAQCLLCQCPSSAMRIWVKESFVAQLECICPQCRTTLRLCELKAHLKSCKILPQPSSCSLSEKSTVKQNADDASLGDHSTSAIRNDGDAGQAMSDSGSQQLAASSSVTAPLSAVPREVVDMMSNDKNELRSEFTQKIEAVLKDMSSLTTSLRPCRRSFQLLFHSRDSRFTTAHVRVLNTEFRFEYEHYNSELTAVVCSIGDHLESFRKAHVEAALVSKKLALSGLRTMRDGAAKTPLTEDDLYADTISLNFDQYTSHMDALSCMREYDYMLEVSFVFDSKPFNRYM